MLITVKACRELKQRLVLVFFLVLFFFSSKRVLLFYKIGQKKERPERESGQVIVKNWN